MSYELIALFMFASMMALLLTGQRALPAKAEQEGFVFRYPHLETALAQVLQKQK